MVSNILIRSLSTVPRNNIGRVFIQDEVQKMLKDITRFNKEKVFRRRQVPTLKSPSLMFMSDEQLKRSKEDAYEHVKARLQMPPVMAADTTAPRVLSKDDDIVGYTKFKIMFVDISPGYTDRNRLMSVREQDGTLREPTHDERSRLNHIFYPGEFRSIDTPKLFEEKNLLKLMLRKEYEFALDRACIQFEPDDPRYVSITSFIYEHIDDAGDYDKLRSTRHFGPMALHLAYHNRADRLIKEMLSKNYEQDAANLTKICEICENIKATS